MSSVSLLFSLLDCPFRFCLARLHSVVYFCLFCAHVYVEMLTLFEYLCTYLPRVVYTSMVRVPAQLYNFAFPFNYAVRSHEGGKSVYSIPCKRIRLVPPFLTDIILP